MRALVTGASGLLGSATAIRLAAVGHDVVGTYFANARDHAGVTMTRLDIRSPTDVYALVAAFEPDVVIHTAYVQAGPDARAAIVDGTRAVSEATARAGARLIHMSTDVVFSGAVGNYDEDAPPDPISDYGRAKRAAEDAVRRAATDAVIVRTSLLVGGATAGPQEALVARALDDPSSVTFYSDEIRSPTSVEDLAESLCELVGHAYVGTLHVAGTDAVGRDVLAHLIASRMGRDGSALRSGPSPPEPRRALDCSLDVTRSHAMLRRPPRGVRRLYDELTW